MTRTSPDPTVPSDDRRGGQTIRRLLVVVLVVLLVVPAPAAAVIRGSPDLDVALPERSVVPGEETTLRLSLSNDADLDEVPLGDPSLASQVTTAGSVSVAVRAGDAPLTVETGRQHVGDVPDGAVIDVPVRVTVDESAAPGTYRLPVTVEYSYAPVVIESAGIVTERTETERLSVTVRVEPRARFAVVDATTDVRPGTPGRVSVTVANVGSETARDTRLALRSESAALRLGGAETDSRYVGTWEPGDRRTVTYQVTASDTARAASYPLSLVATYETTDGESVTTSPLAVGVSPQPELDFAVRNVTGDLRVGEEATLRGAIHNRGNATAYDAVVVLEPPPSVQATEHTFPVGDVGPGEAAEFVYDVAVPSTADSGLRAFAARLEYETADGDPLASDRLRFSRAVAPERDRFAVEPVNATVGIDTENRVTVRLTNTGEEPLSEVQASIEPLPPFTSEAPESYVGRLEPGESATLAFQLTVSEDAVANTHGVPVNVTAELPDGDAVRSGPYLVSVIVVADEGPTASDSAIAAIGAVLVAVILAAGWWWLRR